MNYKEFIDLWRKKYPNPNSLGDNGSPCFYSTKGTNYVQATCPYCDKNGKGPDKSNHCHVHYEEGWYKCHRCGAGGTLTYILGIKKEEKEKEGWSTYTYTDENRPVFKRSRSVGLEGSKLKPGTTMPIDALPIQHPAWQYLLSEGFSEEKILKLAEIHGIYYCSNGIQLTKNEKNTTTHRLIFEIREGSTVYGWQARWLPKHWPKSAEDIEEEKEVEKYLFSPGLKKSYMLYNWDNAQAWDTWIIVEGIKKVWKTGDFSMAGFGIGNTAKPPEEVAQQAYNQFWSVRLLNGQRPIGLLYDKDGLSAAMSHADALREMGADVTVIKLPPHGAKDLDNYTTPEIKQIIKNHMGRLPKKIVSNKNI